MRAGFSTFGSLATCTLGFEAVPGSTFDGFAPIRVIRHFYFRILPADLDFSPLHSFAPLRFRSKRFKRG